ncbi:uncharacterized protein LOC110988735 isoform X2 [Acanthaster planci]|uniref:Uncharacterized protein LOC110988735 isoform X2 n=1 Tax=Acanthaster planci TaxID=133434 RepID=A0A8B7ZS42_ACAPL|nr:uncharacterized protein LOC110988735 isoform X2 [Acanthaster planci]
MEITFWQGHVASLKFFSLADLIGGVRITQGQSDRWTEARSAYQLLESFSLFAFILVTDLLCETTDLQKLSCDHALADTGRWSPGRINGHNFREIRPVVCHHCSRHLLSLLHVLGQGSHAYVRGLCLMLF